MCIKKPKSLNFVIKTKVYVNFNNKAQTANLVIFKTNLRTKYLMSKL